MKKKSLPPLPADKPHSPYSPDYDALPPPLQGVLRVTALTGGLYDRIMLEVLRAVVPPVSSVGWTEGTYRSAVQALRKLRLIHSGGQCSPPALEHALACEAIQDIPLVRAVEQAMTAGAGSVHYQFVVLALRARLSIYAGDAHAFTVLLSTMHSLQAHYAEMYPVDSHMYIFDGQCVALPLEAADWYAARPDGIRFAILTNTIRVLLVGKDPAPLLPVMLKDMPHLLQAHTGRQLPEEILLLLLYQGEFAQVAPTIRMLLADKQLFGGHFLQGMLYFFQGNMAEALPPLREALKLFRRSSGKRKVNLPFPGDMSMALAMLATNDPAECKKVETLADQSDALGAGWNVVKALLYFSRGQEALARRFMDSALQAPVHRPFEKIVVMVGTAVVCGKDAPKHYASVLEEYRQLAPFMPLLGRMLAEFLVRTAPEASTAEFERALATTVQPELRILDLFSPSATWERVFDTLTHVLCHDNPRSGNSTASKRLVWLVHFPYNILIAVEQSAKKQSWTSGRPVSLKRLYEDRASFDYLTPQDQRVLKALTTQRGWRGHTYSFDFEQALPALVEHPLLQDESSRTPFILTQRTVTLDITEQGNGYSIGLSQPDTQGDNASVYVVGDLRVVQEAEDRYCVYQLPPRLKEIKTILGTKPLHIPKAGAAKVLHLLRDIDPAIPVQTHLNAVAECRALPRPVVQLLPFRGGLQIYFGVRPFDSSESPFFPTGQGNMRPIISMGGQTCQTTRIAEDEQREARTLLAACPTLQGYGEGGPWEVVETEDALNVLLECKNFSEAHPEHAPLLEWPQGESLRVEASVSAQQLAVHIQQKRDWFQLRGELTVHEGLVVSMGKLLDTLADSKGVFVPLGDGAFVALTQEFKRQLQRLSSLSESEKDGSRRMHPLGAGALDTALDGVRSLTVDAAWAQLIKRIHAAQEHTPVLPSTLRGELRDYQLEGFVWLSRLAHWGAGACLADDMGLGKTVQTIAVLLEQAPRGAILVVAPTSVCHNWEAEFTRFAPSLQVHRLGMGSTAGRCQLVGSMQAGDVLIVSYGLLHSLAPLLGSRPWQVVVFDEAQALKNAATKRAKASKSLTASFRVALTGTPIENYLEDVWSLFNTINPGLLGTLKSFQKRFGGSSSAARQALKALVRPFILRRTKSTVLTELPPRTEQVLQVALPADERAFYEALRRKALEKLAQPAEGGAGQRKLSILAELVRLRRACCHPSLIDPESQLEGAKLQTFVQLVEELVRGRHKALVFSQFVGHLSIVRKALDERGISYQYLDGATPEKTRQSSVRAFQDGEGDVFLISLKAGGQGLNLTAADYVIHLDPWWNPAVEDQASDRAHRMGQKRPVTVYRLVIEGSVEEKILALHNSKRSLATDFLDGTDSPLSEGDLLALFESGGLHEADSPESPERVDVE